MEKFDIIPLSEWGLGNKDLPLGIAGPCSAETEEQVMETARRLVHKNIHVYRAGVWKPRTRPGSFEGVGEEALKWLQRVRQETGLKIGTEVANAEHVRLALKYDVDVLWIGARTTASPFTMQELAEVLRDTDKVVLVKNPMNPDLDLWERSSGSTFAGCASWGPSTAVSRPMPKPNTAMCRSGRSPSSCAGAIRSFPSSAILRTFRVAGNW